MKKTFVLLFTIVLANLARAEDSPSDADTLKAIETICQNPASSEAKTAVKTVYAVAAQTNRVTVSIPPEVTPWLRAVPKTTVPTETTHILRQAYVAGNLRSQIQSHKKGNDVYAGFVQEIATYKLLKKEDPSLKIAGLEKLSEMEAGGQLKTFVDSLIAKNKSLMN